MFGVLPAYAFYSRHAEVLGFSNVQVRWGKEDARPAMIFDDVKDLTLDGLRTETAAASGPVVWMNNVIDALVRGSRTAATDAFLRVSGARSAGISLIGNDLLRAGRHFEVTDAPPEAVREVAGVTAEPAPQRK